MDIFHQCLLIITILKTLEEIETKVIWFNPPYSQNGETNVGKLFIKPVRNHLRKNNKYQKIFHLNTSKLSHYCTTNAEKWPRWIALLGKINDNSNHKCNFRSKPNCSLNGECLIQCLVCKTTSTTSNSSFVYYGTSEGEFRHCECMNETELSKHVWNVKDKRPQKGFTIPMWFKTLRSRFVRKTFPSFVLIQTFY